VIEVTAIAAVMGRNARPVANAEKPRFCCM
jgi:hypothetical protein